MGVKWKQFDTANFPDKLKATYKRYVEAYEAEATEKAKLLSELRKLYAKETPTNQQLAVNFNGKFLMGAFVAEDAKQAKGKEFFALPQ